MFLVQDVVKDDRVIVYVHDKYGNIIYHDSTEKYVDTHGLVQFSCQYEALIHAVWRLKRHVNA